MFDSLKGVLVTAILATVFALPTTVSAQIAWDAPLLIGPNTSQGLGVLLMNPEPGDELAVMGTWRGDDAPGGVGFRFGAGEGFGGDFAVFVGADASGNVLRASDDFPLDAAWFFGGGISVGDHFLASFPFGFTFGRTLETDGVGFDPYAAPRLSLDGTAGGADDGFDLNFTFDLGADISFVDAFVIRFGASLGDRDTLAAGLSFPI